MLWQSIQQQQAYVAIDFVYIFRLLFAVDSVNQIRDFLWRPLFAFNPIDDVFELLGIGFIKRGAVHEMIKLGLADIN